MKTRVMMGVGIACVALLGARAEAPPAPHPVATAKANLLPFKTGLKKALMEAMKSGPLSAMDVCRAKAPELATQAGKAAGPGVTLGRTSHRLRNPANAPAEWMKPLLAAYQSAGTPQPARTVTLKDGKTGYVEPIYVQTLCLTCHGSNLAEPVRNHLAARYPNDRATGFQEGDFRGMFWLVQDAP